MSTLGREVWRAEIVRKEVGGSSGDSYLVSFIFRDSLRAPEQSTVSLEMSIDRVKVITRNWGKRPVGIQEERRLWLWPRSPELAQQEATRLGDSWEEQNR